MLYSASITAYGDLCAERVFDTEAEALAWLAEAGAPGIDADGRETFEDGVTEYRCEVLPA